MSESIKCPECGIAVNAAFVGDQADWLADHRWAAHGVVVIDNRQPAPPDELAAVDAMSVAALKRLLDERGYRLSVVCLSRVYHVALKPADLGQPATTAASADLVAALTTALRMALAGEV